jgi:hypothetical protein
MFYWTRLFLVSVCALYLSAIAACYALSRQPGVIGHTTSPSSLTAEKMTTGDALFKQVPFGRNERTVCSPEDPGPGFDWRGILVRAPSKIVLSSQDSSRSALTIPLCGYFMINLAKAIRNPGFQVLIVTDDATKQTYRGEIIYPQTDDLVVPPPPTPPLRAEDFEHQASGGYLNVNIAAHVELPLRPARYRVKVEWSGYESNEVSIAVVQRP